MQVGDEVTARYKGVGYTGRVVKVDEKNHEATVSMAPGVEMILPQEDITVRAEGWKMELDKAEQKHAAAVASDLDLVIRARTLTGLPDSVPVSQVLERIHAEYNGGISQFYLAERF